VLPEEGDAAKVTAINNNRSALIAASRAHISAPQCGMQTSGGELWLAGWGTRCLTCSGRPVELANEPSRPKPENKGDDYRASED